jgi:hypothetical protein
MAERPRGLPQRSRKPRPSNTTKHNPTGKRRRNTNRGFRSYEKTEERKLRRRTVTAWSRTLYRCYRGNTLSGQARPGRKRQKLAHDNTRRTAFIEFRQATKEATAQQAHPKGTVKQKRTVKQRRGRAQNEAATTRGRTFRIASLNVQGLNEITKRQSIEKWAHDIGGDKRRGRPKLNWVITQMYQVWGKVKTEFGLLEELKLNISNKTHQDYIRAAADLHVF